MHKGLGPLLGKGRLRVPRDVLAAAFANVDRLHAIKAMHGAGAAHEAGVALINGEAWQNHHWIKSAGGHAETSRLFRELMEAPAPTRRGGVGDFGPREVWDHERGVHVSLERRSGRLYVNGLAGKATEFWPFAVGQTIMGPQLAVKVATSWGEYLLAQEEIA